MKKLSRRELVTILLGAGVLLSVAVWKVGGWLLGREDAAQGSIEGALARIEEYDRLVRSTEALKQELKVTVPEGPVSAQESAMRSELARLAQANGLKLGATRRMETGSSRRGSAVRPLQFRIDLTGPYDGILKLMWALEHAPNPYLVQEVAMNSAGNQPAAVQASFQVQGQIFPPLAAAAPTSAAANRAGGATKATSATLQRSDGITSPLTPPIPGAPQGGRK